MAVKDDRKPVLRDQNDQIERKKENEKRRREERLVSASLLRGGERKDWSVHVY